MLLHPRNTKGAIHVYRSGKHCVRVSPLNPEDYALPQSTTYTQFYRVPVVSCWKSEEEDLSISFVRAKAISRGTGQSAVACAAYRSGQKLIQESDGKKFDYTKKNGLLAEGLHCPDGIKMNREELWNLVEKTENRKDARLAKEFIVALPHELPKDEHKIIAELIAIQLSKGDRFADWAIHEPSEKGDNRNVHAHFLITERGWNRESGTFEKKKNRDWNSEEYLQTQKIAIAEICNGRLKRYKLPTIDPRSYEEKINEGLDVPEPQKHKGVTRTNYERNRVEKLKRIQKNISKLEGLGYGDSRRSAGLGRPIDDRDKRIEKENGTELGSNSESRKSSGRGRGGSSGRGEGFGYGD